MLKITLILVCASATFAIVHSEIPSQDTYLNALQSSHQTNSESISKVADREDVSFHASQGYDYTPAVKPHYGPPPPVYGPPKPIYGPPPPFFAQHLPIPYHPREETWLDKLKLKIDLFTIGKILLKLIIFKKIIKFIALICLLLFLPKLKNLIPDGEDDTGSMEARHFSTDRTNLNERINDITGFALTAMDTFTKKYEGCDRDQIWCRFQRTFDAIDNKYSYDKIVKLYLPNTDISTN